MDDGHTNAKPSCQGVNGGTSGYSWKLSCATASIATGLSIATIARPATTASATNTACATATYPGIPTQASVSTTTDTVVTISALAKARLTTIPTFVLPAHALVLVIARRANLPAAAGFIVLAAGSGCRNECRFNVAQQRVGALC